MEGTPALCLKRLRWPEQFLIGLDVVLRVCNRSYALLVLLNVHPFLPFFLVSLESPRSEVLLRRRLFYGLFRLSRTARSDVVVSCHL